MIILFLRRFFPFELKPDPTNPRGADGKPIFTSRDRELIRFMPLGTFTHGLKLPSGLTTGDISFQLSDDFETNIQYILVHLAR